MAEPLAGVLAARWRELGDIPALAGPWGVATYDQILERQAVLEEVLDALAVRAGDRVLVLGDHGPAGAAALLECLRRQAVVVPLTARSFDRRADRLRSLAWADVLVRADDLSDAKGAFQAERLPDSHPGQPEPALLAQLRTSGRPGMILFTSGSSGEPKVVVHDLTRLLEPFRHPGRPLRTVSVLLFDHWGGLNTLFRVLSSGGLLACPESRRPDDVLALVDHYGLELLPASPSFLNMMIISGAIGRHDLASLRTITYGAEPMPPTLLARLAKTFPDVRLQQTYGLVELGVMSTRSERSDSLLMTIGGEGYEHRVVDGLLEIRAESSMMGYLNAASPFTDDGFFRTGDRVEEHEGFLRVLGRDSEMISVGGEKVMPTEVESVLLDCEMVAEAVAYGEPHPLLGQVVVADVVLRSMHDGVRPDATDARRAVRRHCTERLPAYQVPMKVRVVDGPLVNDRQKRIRPATEGAGGSA